MKFNSIALPVLVLSTLGLAACGSSSSSSDDNGFVALVNELENLAPPEGTIDTTDDNDAADITPGTLPAARTPAVDTADTGSNPLFYATGNNSAHLTGPVFGTGEFADSELVEKLEVFGQIGGQSESIEAVYAVHGQLQFGITELITVLHNTRDLPECGGTFEINVVNKDGSLLSRPGVSEPKNFRGRVEGSRFESIGALPNGDSLSIDCVGPGEIVYGRIDIDDEDTTEGLTNFGDQAGITGGVRLFGPGGNNDAPALDPVLPLSYTVNDEGFVELLVENQGNITLQIGGRIYPLTPEGFPMTDILNSGADPDIAPGATGILEFNANRFPGSASALRAVLSLDFISE